MFVAPPAPQKGSKQAKRPITNCIYLLQIPSVDWIVQFDPPDDPRDYIHRVGRTARGANGKGRSLMFLQPSEVGFLKHLKEARVPCVEFEFPAKRIVNVQSQLEKLIGQNYYLNKVCRRTCSMHYLTPLPSFFFELVVEMLTGIDMASPQKTAIDPTSKPTPRTACALSSTSTSWTWSKSPRVSDFRRRRASTLRWVRA